MFPIDWRAVGLALTFSVQVIFIGRALLRPHRQPASRVAWVAIIGALPILGVLAYIVLGETNMGRGLVSRIKAARETLPIPGKATEDLVDVERLFHLSPRQAPLFRVGQSASGYPPQAGNRATLLSDSNSAIDAIVNDIDLARDHVHICFYIWLADVNGMKVVEALRRAAARGVTCRALADALGSRALIRHAAWKAMKVSGVRMVKAMPLGHIFVWPFHGRLDMRNHRKIVVIDNRVTYCGSQNCADPEFLPKARFAPWVDLMARFEGPVVLQNQHLFATDWMAHTGEDLTSLLSSPTIEEAAGFVAQVVGTSAAIHYAAMPEMFISLMNAASDELTVTTPYYVPDESIQFALCASARRGVRTTLTVPTRNDSWVVAGASRSYYEELLDAGVRIFEYPHGLLHAKCLTLDGETSLIGSANLDRRSFDLNFENTILLSDRDFTAQLRARQQSYIDASIEIALEDVSGWSWRRRLWNNTLAMIGPVI